MWHVQQKIGKCFIHRCPDLAIDADLFTLRNTKSGNRLNHCILLHVHRKNSDQLNIIEIAKEFVGEKQARLRTLAGFENTKDSSKITTIYSKQKKKDKISMFNVISNNRNIRQYFCQCFSFLLVNGFTLTPLTLSFNEINLSTPMHIFSLF